MKLFYLERNVDVTGISGIGIVAEGVEFSDGTVVVRWLSSIATTTVYNSIEHVKKINCHGGNTEIIWIDENKEGNTPSSKSDTGRYSIVTESKRKITSPKPPPPSPHSPHSPFPHSPFPFPHSPPIYISDDPMSCNHANEVPTYCPCDADCYCKSRTCKNKHTMKDLEKADNRTKTLKSIKAIKDED